MTKESVVTRIDILLSQMNPEKTYVCPAWGKWMTHTGDNNFNSGIITSWRDNINMRATGELMPTKTLVIMLTVMNEIWKEVNK